MTWPQFTLKAFVIAVVLLGAYVAHFVLGETPDWMVKLAMGGAVAAAGLEAVDRLAK